MKKKTIIIILSVVVLFVVGIGVWWVHPVHFLKGIDPDEISSIEVFNGNDGNRFDITDTADIRFITEQIQAVPMHKDSIALGMGTTYNLCFLDADGREIDRFILMSPSIIRDGMVFYRCAGELQQAEAYLMQLEGVRFPDTDWIKNQDGAVSRIS